MSNAAPEASEQTGEPRRQRLVICFDGTWNNRDSSTNVFHIHNFVKEGEVLNHKGEPVFQRRYYDEGVGTGVLDGVSGGAFGLGLDANVREAYNWLVEHYQRWDLDEVFIFGFSRGAYTARSLVGFIMRFGLLRRGSPVTVKQLWQAYTQYGKFSAGRLSKQPFRDISSLVTDPWQGSRPRVQPDENEKLFLQYSRRIPIQFLGIYDTVGAMGWDALAIPGLRSKIGITHNMRLSTIVRRCYHAAAIDEYRSSFVLTPLLQFEGYGKGWDRNRSERQRNKWDKRVQQRWFVGAHSNIGGGYPDNRLATHALNWMLTGAVERGLQLNAPVPEASEAKAVERKDSYLEFSKGFWAHVIRAKRNFRRLDPSLDVRGTPNTWREREENDDADEETDAGAGTDPERAARAKEEETGKDAPRSAEEFAGYSLRFVNPTLDDSVLRIADADPHYAPPNLVSYAERQIRNRPPCPPGAPDPGRTGDGAGEEASAARPARKSTQPRKKSAARKSTTTTAKETGAGKSARKKKAATKKSARTRKKTARKRTAENAKARAATRMVVRKKDAAPPAPELDREGILARLAQRTPVHDWLPTARERGWFVIWTLLAVCGFTALPALLGIPVEIPLFALCVLAVLIPLLDWGESRATFSLARHPEDEPGTSGPRRRALYDVLFSLRGLALVFFALGLAVFVIAFAKVGLATDWWWGTVRGAWSLIAEWWLVALLPVAITALFALRADLKLAPKRLAKGLATVVAAPLILALIGVLIALNASWLSAALGGEPGDASPAAASTPNLAGVLLLLHLAFVAIGQGFTFVRTPMLTANLGGIVPLQLGGFTPARVRAQLKRWRRKLTPKNDPRPGEATPAQRLQYYLNGSLWRDTIGLVPVYGAALGFGLWVGVTQLDWVFLAQPYFHVPLWIWLAGGAVGADFIENAVHLYYLRNFAEKGEPEWGPVVVGTLATAVKFVAFLTAATLFSAIWFALCVKIFSSPAEFGWRGILAGALAIPVGLTVAAVYLNIVWRIGKAVAMWISTPDAAEVNARTTSG